MVMKMVTMMVLHVLKLQAVFGLMFAAVVAGGLLLISISSSQPFMHKIHPWRASGLIVAPVALARAYLSAVP